MSKNTIAHGTMMLMSVDSLGPVGSTAFLKAEGVGLTVGAVGVRVGKVQFL